MVTQKWTGEESVLVETVFFVAETMPFFLVVLQDIHELL